MAVKIHYDDDLFFVHSMVRLLAEGVQLDIDSELFHDKIVEDIYFVDHTLQHLYRSLRDNEYLINRVGYVRTLRRTVVAFHDFLNGLLQRTNAFARSMEPYSEKLSATREDHERIRVEIDALLDRLEPDEESSDIVSSEEFGFLLAPHEDDEPGTHA